MLRGEPDSWSAEAGGPTHHASFRSKVYNAKDRGAAAVLIVNQAPVEGEEDRLAEFVEESSEAYGIPAFHVTRAFAASRLAAAQCPALEELETKLTTGAFVSQPLAHQTASGFAGLETIEAPVSNVVAILRGRGPQADECIVIGAHYDHLGVRKPRTRRFKAGKLVSEETPPQVHNGADDNASGVAGLIEIARMFSEGPPTNRSVVFAAFTAEESGLHGSKYFVEHPVCRLDHTAAMLNMDMIGRMKPGANRVLVFGAESGTGVEEVVMQAARQLGMTYEVTGDSGGRSDHAPFVQSSVPSMHFMTGLHRDYHQPSDDSEKINARGGAAVARLVHDVAVELADQSERPEFVALKRTRAPAGDSSGGTPSYRVVMGLAPGYADDGKPGMAVEYVTDEGPAFMAGMRGGDRIIRIDDRDVANIYDYMAATRGNNPGDTVTVVVLRDGEELTLQVTLAAAR
jgi:Zn-dependent M28 family amino/carboxypeptidase